MLWTKEGSEVTFGSRTHTDQVMILELTKLGSNLARGIPWIKWTYTQLDAGQFLWPMHETEIDQMIIASKWALTGDRNWMRRLMPCFTSLPSCILIISPTKWFFCPLGGWFHQLSRSFPWGRYQLTDRRSKKRFGSHTFQIMSFHTNDHQRWNMNNTCNTIIEKASLWIKQWKAHF